MSVELLNESEIDGFGRVVNVRGRFDESLKYFEENGLRQISGKEFTRAFFFDPTSPVFQSIGTYLPIFSLRNPKDSKGLYIVSQDFLAKNDEGLDKLIQDNLEGRQSVVKAETVRKAALLSLNGGLSDSLGLTVGSKYISFSARDIERDFLGHIIFNFAGSKGKFSGALRVRGFRNISLFHDSPYNVRLEDEPYVKPFYLYSWEDKDKRQHLSLSCTGFLPFRNTMLTTLGVSKDKK